MRVRLGILVACVVSAAAAPSVPTRPAALWAWDDPVEVARGGGNRGPWQMNRSVYDFVDDPTVALRGSAAAIAWVDHREKDVFFEIRDEEERREGPVNVSRSPTTFSWLPRVAFGPGTGDGNVYVVWQEIIFSGGSHGGEILFARSKDGGRSFKPPVNLSRSTAGDGKGRLTRDDWHNGSLDVAVAPSGTIYVAWTEYEGRLWLRRSSDGGESFASAVRIDGDGKRPARGPSLATAPDGAVFVAWTVGEDPTADVWLSSSRAAGLFGAPRTAVACSGHCDGAKLAVADDATIHLVYAESATGPSGAYRLRYTRAPDSAGQFVEPIDLVTPGSTGAASLGFPSLAVAGPADLLVLWERFPDPAARPQGLGIAASRDGGASFAVGVVPEISGAGLGTNGSQQGLLTRKLAANRAGAFAVTNSTFEREKASHIWLSWGQLVSTD